MIRLLLIFISLLILGCSGEEPIPLPLKIRDLPVGIDVTHSPALVHPSLSEDWPDDDYKYYWVHETAVSAISQDLTIVQFGGFGLEDGVWIERSIYDRPFNRGEFEDWYDCPSGKLTVGETYIDDHNYTASNGLVTKSERTLWYYIGVNTDGDKFVGYQDVMFDSELE